MGLNKCASAKLIVIHTGDLPASSLKLLLRFIAVSGELELNRTVRVGRGAGIFSGSVSSEMDAVATSALLVDKASFDERLHVNNAGSGGDGATAQSCAKHIDSDKLGLVLAGRIGCYLPDGMLFGDALVQLGLAALEERSGATASTGILALMAPPAGFPTAAADAAANATGALAGTIAVTQAVQREHALGRHLLPRLHRGRSRCDGAPNNELRQPP